MPNDMLGLTKVMLDGSPLEKQSKQHQWISRALEFLWLLAIVLVPLVFLGREFGAGSSTIGSFELPKIVILRLLVGLMASLWLIEWGLQARISGAGLWNRSSPALWLSGIRRWLQESPTRWLYLAVAFFAGATLLSTVLSASLDVSLWGEVPGQDSYSAYTTFAYVLLFAVISSHLRTQSQLWRLLGAIVVMGVLVAAYSVLQHYGHDVFYLMVPPTAERTTSTLSNPILAGAVMLMTILISLVAATITLRGSMITSGFWWKLGAWGLVLAVQLLGLLFTYTRGPSTGTIVALVAFISLTLVFANWRIAVKAGMVLAVAVLVAAAVVILPARQGEQQSAAVSRSGPVSELVSSVAAQVPILGGESGAGRLSGRVEIWKDSWGLMTHHPWFGFDSLSLPFLRSLVGYGPDLFHSTYLLVSRPGFDMVPSEMSHAHNYFVHQGVELGFLGLVSALSLFAAVLLAGSYQLLWRRKDYSMVYKMLLIGLLATLVGRLIEQMVGVARVSDLTIFWVLLAAFAALPAIMEVRRNSPGLALRDLQRTGENHVRLDNAPDRRPYHWQFLGRLALIACVVAGIGVLTWGKGINYVRAAVIADRAAEEFHDGFLQNSLSSLEQAISLAPDVSTYYGHRAAVYSAIGRESSLDQHLECGDLPDMRAKKVCLAEETYLSNVNWVQIRPFSFRSRMALANSALALALLKHDAHFASEAIRLHREVTDMVPNSYRSWNRLAEVSIVLGQPDGALPPLEKSLEITGDVDQSFVALLLQAKAYLSLGEPNMAIARTDDAIRIYSNNPEIYANRAFAYTLLGKDDMAQQEVARAVGSGFDRDVLVSAIEKLKQRWPAKSTHTPDAQN